MHEPMNPGHEPGVTNGPGPADERGANGDGEPGPYAGPATPGAAGSGVPDPVCEEAGAPGEAGSAPPTPPPESPPDRTAEVLAAIRALGDDLGRQLGGLRTAFDREIRAEANREKVVDRLHGELQEYKQDLLRTALRPIVVDLIQLHDDIGKIVAAHDRPAPGDPPGSDDGAAPAPDATAARWLDLMRGFQQAIDDILYRQGVEPYAVEGEAFEPRRQRAVVTVPTDDPDRFRTIAARLRPGYRLGERVIRPELVSVYSPRRPAG